MNTGVKEARETKIYTVEQCNCKYQENYVVPTIVNSERSMVSYHDEAQAKAAAAQSGTKIIRLQPRLIRCDYRVAEDTLYDFVMASAEETTSPVGVMSRLHIRHEGIDCRYGRLNAVNNESGNYEVWIWNRANKGEFIQEFDSEAEAEDFLFQRTYEYDFLNDDQRDTMYYDTYEEAESEMVRLYAEQYDVDIDVAVSIIHHKGCARQIIETRKIKALEAAKAERERRQAIANEYAKMISKIDGESYKETAARLSAAIGERIESGVFHLAVKMIRNRG